MPLSASRLRSPPGCTPSASTTTHPAASLEEAGADEVVANLVGYDVARLLQHLKARAEDRG